MCQGRSLLQSGLPFTLSSTNLRTSFASPFFHSVLFRFFSLGSGFIAKLFASKTLFSDAEGSRPSHPKFLFDFSAYLKSIQSFSLYSSAFPGPLIVMKWTRLLGVALASAQYANALIRFGCSQLVTERYDPWVDSYLCSLFGCHWRPSLFVRLVNPGKVSPHLHQIVGGVWYHNVRITHVALTSWSLSILASLS